MIEMPKFSDDEIERGGVEAGYRARIEKLENTIREMYAWAHGPVHYSDLEELVRDAVVDCSAYGRTPTRMRKVWLKGCEQEALSGISRSRLEPEDAVYEMLKYTALMRGAGVQVGEPVQDCLWGVARAAADLLPLSSANTVIEDAIAEYLRAAEKHPGMTLECVGHTDATRLYALVEEIGEVAAALTYDNDVETGHNAQLEDEAIQVVALALAWATRYLDDGDV
jgi:hypothetical protein